MKLVSLLLLFLTAFGFYSTNSSSSYNYDIDNDGIDDVLEQMLAETFSPVIKFHPDEKFYPTSVESFLNASNLMYYHDDDLKLNCLVSDNVNIDNLLTFQHQDTITCLSNKCMHSGDVKSSDSTHSNSTKFNLQLKTSEFYTGSSNLDSVPVYAHVHPSQNEIFPNTITIQYWFLYAFNGPQMKCLGAHEGDFEHISIIYDTYSITHAYYSAHSHEGTWKPVSEISFINGTHPIVYSALNSHASYESPGVKKRKTTFGIINDHCADGGEVWTPTAINIGESQRPMPGSEWIQYSGSWGSLTSVKFPCAAFDGSPPENPSIQRDYWIYN